MKAALCAAVLAGAFVVASQVCERVMGHGERAPTPDELKRMTGRVADAMTQGA